MAFPVEPSPEKREPIQKALDAISHPALFYSFCGDYSPIGKAVNLAAFSFYSLTLPLLRLTSTRTSAALIKRTALTMATGKLSPVGT